MKAGDAQAALRALPVRDFAEVFGDRPLMVLAPHPDDESLGCGGILLEAAARGVPTFIAVLTDGAASHPGSRAWPPARLAAARRAELIAAAGILGVPEARVIFLGAPDGGAPHEGAAFDALAARLRAVVRAWNVTTLLSTWIGDPHGDHGSAAKLAGAVGDTRVLFYPVWAWTVPVSGWLPDIGSGARLDVARHLAAKRAAIACHWTQLGLITDDPDGFAMNAGFLSLFDGPFETVLER